MRTFTRIAFGIASAALLYSPLALAHSGGTDANGCHTNKKTGEYHCHGGKSAKTAAKTAAKTEARTSAKVVCSANIYNCSNFSTHSEAQGVYEGCLEKVGRDVHDLDRDDDGVACEALQ